MNSQGSHNPTNMDEDAVRVRIAQELASIGRDVWDRFANPGWHVGAGGRLKPAGDMPAADPYNPFVGYDFLQCLEEAGCAVARTGWLGQHMIAEDHQGTPIGVVPAYLKNQSQGEYVFDHGWADAFERAGGRYYPKLQISVPFSPVTAPKLLTRPGTKRKEIRAVLASAIVELTRSHGASSAHLTFLTASEYEQLGDLGFLRRTDRQFHWLNDNYTSFDAFLDALSSRKRKNIRKERRAALANGITIEWITGPDLTEEHWDAFYRFYMDTGSRKWGTPYLNRAFFSLLGERLGERVLLVMARRDDRYIAGALNLIGSDALYGRNWGCIEDHPCLHFEVCYYQAIDFAISRGLSRVESGAQGAHKLARGYMPNIVHSAHFVAHPGFRQAVADYLQHERMLVLHEAEHLSGHAPFKRGDR